MTQVPQSQLIMAKSGSNLAAAFFLLSKSRRKGMVALYAFCREVDDVADDDAVPLAKRAEKLHQWRDDIRRACEWGEPQFEVCRELRPFIREYNLPFSLFDELLIGMESDLQKMRYRDFDELKLYCHRAASVVGLLSIRIFGCDGKAAQRYAENLGQALQLTNILRDVAEDAARGRIYLPQSMLEKHSVDESDILENRFSVGYENAAQEIAERAWAHYRLARELFPLEQKHQLVASEAMGATYWRLLMKLRAVRYNAFQSNRRRLKTGRLVKLAIGLKTCLSVRCKAYRPVYG